MEMCNGVKIRATLATPGERVSAFIPDPNDPARYRSARGDTFAHACANLRVMIVGDQAYAASYERTENTELALMDRQTAESEQRAKEGAFWPEPPPFLQKPTEAARQLRALADYIDAAIEIAASAEIVCAGTLADQARAAARAKLFDAFGVSPV